MPKYAKFMKDLLTKRRQGNPTWVTLNERCSSVLMNEMPSKEKDPGSFTIPCTINGTTFDKALGDLGASISLMPYSLYRKLELDKLTPTRMCIELANKSTQYPKGVAENVLVKIDKFIFPVDFVIIDMKEDIDIPILLGRPFLATAHAMIDVFNKKNSLEIGKEKITCDLERSMKYATFTDDDMEEVDFIDSTIEDFVEDFLPQEQLHSVLSKDHADKSEHEETTDVNSVQEPLHKDDFITKETASIPKLKELPPHLEYAFLDDKPEHPELSSILRNIEELESDMNSLTEKVNMVQSVFETPIEDRVSSIERCVKFFIRETFHNQRETQEIIWGIKTENTGELPSTTETNPRDLAHAITTRSGLNKEPAYPSTTNDALADLGTSISLMPYSLYRRLELDKLTPTRMCIELANKSTQYPKGVAKNVLLKIDKFIFLVDFVIIDMKEDIDIPILLGRPFLATAHAMIDEKITYDLERSMKYATFTDDDMEEVDFIDSTIEDFVEDFLPQEQLHSVLSNDHADKSEHEETTDVNIVQEPLHKDDFITKETASIPKLKELPPHLEYAFLDDKPEHPELSKHKGASLGRCPTSRKSVHPSVLTRFLWKMISNRSYNHNEGLIYAISDNAWVSPIHVVPKKGGTTVIVNEDNDDQRVQMMKNRKYLYSKTHKTLGNDQKATIMPLVRKDNEWWRFDETNGCDGDLIKRLRSCHTSTVRIETRLSKTVV
ncbi:hypothetical protein CTI12_AA120600 [Artemisia annua]|uniref:Reverse transcriptase domain-containing protein n=1 Tax=Artemisia annua TaxID=35608 RepID=A0A2U1PIY6_ARTAN|nr:hypothetical protein CTI12_AA120600 [Artemisia annua]